jgi:VanZ family protein
MSVRRIAGRRRRFGLPQLLALLATITVGLHVYGLYRPSGPPAPIWFPYADKVQHLIGFAVPVGLILLALRRGSRERAAAVRSRAVPVVVGLFVLHAVVSELAQHFFYTWRTGDPLDVLADWAGVLLGWGMFALLARDRRPQDQRRLDTAPAQVPR